MVTNRARLISYNSPIINLDCEAVSVAESIDLTTTNSAMQITAKDRKDIKTTDNRLTGCHKGKEQNNNIAEG